MGMNAAALGTAVWAAVVAAVVATVLAWLKGWLACLGRWTQRIVSRKTRPDHLAIGTGWTGQNAGAAKTFRVEIKCGPAATLRAPRLIDEVIATKWATEVLGANATLDAWYPKTEHVRFRLDSNADSSENGFALLWPNGLLEAIVPIPHKLSEDGRPTIAVGDIAAVIARFASTVRRGAHAEIFGRNWRDRHRVDWCIGVSPAISTSQYTPWGALTFPGREPARRAASAGPPWSRAGFGAEALRDISPEIDATEVVVNAISDLVDQSGYVGTSECLADVRRSLSSAARP